MEKRPQSELESKMIPFKTVCYEIQQRNPGAVIYLETGGRSLGDSLGAALGVPVYGLNIRYPISRWMSSYPVAAPLLWLVKEIMYKLMKPTLGDISVFPSHLTPPVVLADDRISSGRTLSLAIHALQSFGISVSDMIVVTPRAGKKATSLVDYLIESV